MKADWNDAPDYITRHPRKSRRLAKLIPGLIGTVITLAVLQMAGSAFLQATAQRIAEKRIQPKPVPVAEISRAEPAPARNWDKVVEEVAARGATPQPKSGQPQTDLIETQPSKQTVFNDSNYTPQGATNIIPATRVIPEQAVKVPASKKEIVVVGKQSRLSDFCPYKAGSIERRNCKMNVELSNRNYAR
ncbi:hypothetical protein MCB86_03850 [Pseudomonas sp. KSR10]|uniref:hypothetical protein n=1 Tax=Pseudomonas sp. KSR10 TaxID=2916654 RepID=UPI001EF7B3C3|nr:hypothetical protein [Pseudomonas sp. KSR10]MCG6539207.1 hypothetical protein [Pseudomonas sp. KSR10]